MEEKLIAALDQLTIGQTERLLDERIELKMGKKQMDRVRKNVYRKTGFQNRKKREFPKKTAACLAALAILFTSLAFVGFDTVAAALRQLFGVIPGYGIQENNESIHYVLAAPVSVENEDVRLTLNSAIATENGVTVLFTLEHKKTAWQEKEERRLSGGTPDRLNVALYAEGRKVTTYTGYTGGGGKSETSAFTFALNAGEIGAGKTYQLEYGDYGLCLLFQLKPYEHFLTLEEIGPTEYHNDISVTAVPAFLDGKVQVDLYAMNKSGYVLQSFCKMDRPYQNQDLFLQTESGIKHYSIPDGFGGVNSRFLFDIQNSDRFFTLKIPYLTVKTEEEQHVALRIPEEGEKLEVNQQIEFRDCTMTIVTVEKNMSRHIGEFGELKMTIRYENKADNKRMLHPYFARTSIWGKEQSGSWSADVDENGVYTTVYYALEKGERGKLRLKIFDPTYCLTEEYSLQFSR